MKKLIILLLMSASINVLAEWTWVAANNGLTVYADLKYIQKKGNKIVMRNLWDYKTTSPSRNFSSSIGVEEYYCEKKLFNVLTTSFYSENMAQGNITGTVTPNNETLMEIDLLKSLVPVQYELFQVACKQSVLPDPVCLAYSVMRQTCATAGNFSQCMSIRWNDDWVKKEKECH